MDNLQQIKEIMSYREHLCTIVHRELNLDTVAAIWIRKYAKLWRQDHNLDDTKS
jgi:hypothetical protein